MKSPKVGNGKAFDADEGGDVELTKVAGPEDVQLAGTIIYMHYNYSNNRVFYNY